MSDLISRQALCEYALNQKDKAVTPNVEFKNITFDCKTIKDASGHIFVRQKAGEWKKEIEGNGWNEWAVLTCDQCGTIIENPTFEMNYCPNCGAKMGGEDK